MLNEFFTRGVSGFVFSDSNPEGRYSAAWPEAHPMNRVGGLCFSKSPNHKPSKDLWLFKNAVSIGKV
jgi:hypothetical protein